MNIEKEIESYNTIECNSCQKKGMLIQKAAKIDILLKNQLVLALVSETSKWLLF